MIIFLWPIPKHGNNLSRCKLKHGKCRQRQNKATGNCKKVGFPNSLELFCPIIKTDDGLQSLGNANDKGHENLVYLSNDSGTGNGHRLSIDRTQSIIFQGFIHYNLHQHHGKLIAARRCSECNQPNQNPSLHS